MKRQERIEELVGAMKSFAKDRYQREEVLPEMLELQRELIALTFNGEHAEQGRLRIWDVEAHLEKLNAERGHVADAELAVFMEGSKVLCNAIKAEMSGNAGEFKAFRSIETLRCPYKLLKNVEFQNGDHHTELDGVVFTEKGVFIIEVKNTAKDIYIDERGNYCRVSDIMRFDKNIGDSMNDKEYLLREAFKAAGIECPKIASYVVFTNNNVHVDNRYAYITTCFLGQLPRMIESYQSDAHYSMDEIECMIAAANNAACKNSYALPLDVNKYKNDFATLVAILEEAEDATEEVAEPEAETEKKTEEKEQPASGIRVIAGPELWRARRREKIQVGAVASAAGMFFGVAVAVMFNYLKKH